MLPRCPPKALALRSEELGNASKLALCLLSDDVQRVERIFEKGAMARLDAICITGRPAGAGTQV
ncbi:MAG: hypothetical protein OER77_12570 [Myxococcales bacterium]|nr:hypothetical protein [Myxococcales bacterium]